MRAPCAKLLRLLAGAALLIAAGCAQVPMGAPVASIDNIQKARTSGVAPLAVGNFALASGKEPAIDQRVSIRSNTVYSPYGSSFARYLQETLKTDLAAAGLLDAGSSLTLEGSLVDSRLDVPAGQAHGAVAAVFTLKRAGAMVYEKQHRAEAQWQASFIGVEAIPAAINQYGLLYRRLVGLLLDDADFQAAARK